jgi:CrcB protein
MMVLSLVLILFVGLAGSLGALARYLLGRYIAERVISQFPLGTLLINVTGAFLIGLLFTLTGRNFLSVSLQTILATGFLGGYTTFSTMSWEGVQLARGGSTPLSILYLGGSILLGLFAAALGMVLGWGL